MGANATERDISAPPAAFTMPQGDYRRASPSEARRALGQQRRVYARASRDGAWMQVTVIENLFERGVRTPAWTIRFVGGHVKTALDGDFLVEHR